MHYILTLFDTILNVPVSEGIIPRRIPKNTKKFILESTKNKPFICLTTKLFPTYRNVTNEIRVNHQSCIFHLFQTIQHKLKVTAEEIRLMEKKETIFMKMHRIKKLFHTKLNKRINRTFKTIFTKLNSQPLVLNDFIRKHIINHFTDMYNT